MRWCVRMLSKRHPASQPLAGDLKETMTKEQLPRCLSGKESTCQSRRHRSDPWVGEDPLEEEMATCSNILGWKTHGQRRLVGYSLWGHQESDMTEHTHVHHDQ